MRNLFRFSGICFVWFFNYGTLPAQCSTNFKIKGETSCNQVISFEAEVSGSGPDALYKWSFGDGAFGEGRTITHTYEAFGSGKKSFEITLTVSQGANSCSKSKSITLDEVPDPGFGGDAGLDERPFGSCGKLPDTVIVFGRSKTPDAIKSVDISWGDGSADYHGKIFPSNLAHIYNKIGLSTINVTVQGKNGCAAVKKQDYFAGAKPAVGISKPMMGSVQCGPYEVTLIIEGVDGNAPGTTYTLHFNDGSPDQTFSHPPPNMVKHIFTTASCGIAPEGFNATITAENPCNKSWAKIELLHINAPPTPVMSVDRPANACSGEVFTFTNKSSSFEFTEGLDCREKAPTTEWRILPDEGYSIVSGSLTSPVLKVAFNKKGAFIVEMNTKGSCDSISRTSQQVVILDPPKAGFQIQKDPGNSNNCVPYKISLKNTSVNQIRNTWKIEPSTGWTFGEGSSPASADPVIVFRVPGRYTIALEAENGCATSKHTEVLIVAGPPRVFVEDIPDACQDIRIRPGARIEDGYAPIKHWKWTYPGGVSEAENPGELLIQAPINAIALAVENACGEGRDADTIRIIRPESFKAGDDRIVCSGDTCFKLPEPGSGGRWTGDVDPGGVFCPESGSPGATYYAVYTLQTGACELRDTLHISIQPAPEILISRDTTLCLSSGVQQLRAQSPGCNWSGTGVSACGEFDPTVAGTGVHVLTFRMEEAEKKCTHAAMVRVGVEAPVEFKLPDTLSVCLSEKAVTLTRRVQAPPALAGSAVWTGAVIENASTGLLRADAAPGVYRLQYATGPGKGCSYSDSTHILLKDLPRASTSGDTLICISEAAVLLPGFPAGGEWKAVSAGAPEIGARTGAIGSAEAGAFTYRYTVEKNTACETSAELEVRFLNRPKADAGADLFLCAMDTVLTLDDSPGRQVQWSGAGVFYENGWKSAIGQLLPGEYPLYAEVKGEPAGCDGRDSLIMTLFPPPKAGFSAPEEICVHDPVRFANTSAGVTDVIWDFGDGESSREPEPEHTYRKAGTYPVSLLVYFRHPADRSRLLGQDRIIREVLVDQPPEIDSYEVDIDPRARPAAVEVKLGEPAQTSTEVRSEIEPIPGKLKAKEAYYVVVTARNGCGLTIRKDKVTFARCPRCKQADRDPSVSLRSSDRGSKRKRGFDCYRFTKN